MKVPGAFRRGCATPLALLIACFSLLTFPGSFAAKSAIKRETSPQKVLRAKSSATRAKIPPAATVGRKPAEHAGTSGQRDAAADDTSLYRSAEQDWNTGAWAPALQKYELLSKDNSEYASKAHIQLGKYYKYFGRWRKAMEHYEEAIKTARSRRDQEDALTSIAAVHLSKGDYQAALSIFQDVVVHTQDWQQVKYSGYWIKELKRRMAFGRKTEGCSRCGAGAIREVFRLKNLKLSAGEINGLIGLAISGISMYDLKQLALAKGLPAYGVRFTLDQLRSSTLPAIVLRDDPRHYLIVTGFGPQGIGIIDPEIAAAPYTMPEDEFAQDWMGYALIFSEETPELKAALLRDDEMMNLSGKVCYCCPESNNGLDVPNAATPKEECPGSSVYVNSVNLNLIYQSTDLVYSGRGPAIQFTRTYNADDSRDGPLGHSWTHNYNVILSQIVNGNVDIRRESGSIHRFTYLGGNAYSPPPAKYDSLIKKSDNTFTLTLKRSRIRQTFDATGKLTRIADRNGNTVTLQYDSNARLILITDAVGRATTLVYGSNGKLASIEDPLGRTVSYGYDAQGNLISVTDRAGQKVSYTYDANSYLTAITTPRGTSSFELSQSYEGYAIKSMTDPLGNKKTYGTYGSHYVVRITDANGNPTDYENDYNGYTSKITDALGNSVTYQYNSHGQRTSIEDPNRKKTLMQYDAAGNVAKITDPVGNSTTLTYDSSDSLAGITNALGHTATAQYDASGNLLKLTDPKQGTIIFSYNAFGEVTALTDANNNSTSFAYDNYGNITAQTTPARRSSSYVYDTLGRITARTDPKGDVASFTYDNLDRLTAIAYQDGGVKSFVYDCCRLAAVSAPNGTMRFAYAADNTLISATDVYGLTISYGYDKARNLVALTYPDGKVVRYEYDAVNRMTKVADWLGNIATYEYDPAGYLIKNSMPDGSTVSRSYDSAGRLTTRRDFRADASVISSYDYSYNAIGSITNLSFYQPLMPNAAAGLQGIYKYDAENRLLSAADTNFTYNPNGNLTSLLRGNQETAFSWDSSYHLTQAITNGVVTSYKYDPLGNRIAKSAGATETQYVVDVSDPSARILLERDANGGVGSYYVYGLGLMSRITSSGQAYFYHYDRYGSTIGLSNSSAELINKYSYDSFGKAVNQIEALPNSFKYLGLYGVMDDGTGLIYMHSRYYNPETGRFISMESARTSSGANRYAYVENNPASYADPSGLILVYADDGSEAAIKPYVEQIRGTAVGQSLLQKLEKSPETYTIHSECGSADAYALGNDVYVDPNFHPMIQTTAGPIDASTTRILAHELGHLTGIGDSGSGRMANVITWENPVMFPLEPYYRTKY